VGNVYFFTGFPGFIASTLLEELIGKWAPEKVYTLVLPQMKDKAIAEKERICSSTRFPYEKWEVVEGDIAKPHLALSKERLHMLAPSVTHVFHLAAIYDLAVPENIARTVNVEGTKQVNEWVSSLPNLQRYVYFSTAYVSGTRQGVIFEHELDKGQAFKNHYEETKFLAEVAVQEVARHVPTTMIRPGIVVGHSKTGETIKFDGLYFMLNMFERLKFLPIIPYLGKGEAQGNFVPVDYIIDATLYLAHADEANWQNVSFNRSKPVQNERHLSDDDDRIPWKRTKRNAAASSCQMGDVVFVYPPVAACGKRSARIF